MMAEDGTPMAESLLPYGDWAQEAMRQVVLSAIRHVASEGLPGGHHFYITFKTGYPGVVIPERLRAQYPEEMTIVLQHQFHSLSTTADSITVGLSFSGVPALLTIPLAAISAFADPAVQFVLNFEVASPELGPVPEIPAPEGDDVPSREPTGPAAVVSLDAFRKRKD
jgi:hypothetical protein